MRREKVAGNYVGVHDKDGNLLAGNWNDPAYEVQEMGRTKNDLSINKADKNSHLICSITQT